MKTICKNCRFFDKEKSECHRSTPLYIDKERSLWPFIFNDEKCWCGEWKLSPDFLEDRIRLIAIDGGKVVDQADLYLPSTIEKSFDTFLNTAKVGIRIEIYTKEKKEWTEQT